MSEILQELHFDFKDFASYAWFIFVKCCYLQESKNTFFSMSSTFRIKKPLKMSN